MAYSSRHGSRVLRFQSAELYSNHGSRDTAPRRESEDLPDLGFTLPAGPVALVGFHETDGPIDRFLFRGHFVDRIASDQLLGFGEWSIDDVELALRQSDPSAGR